MNITRIALASLAALIAYFLVGGLFFALPAMRTEFAKYPSVFRSGDAMNAVMAVGMLGILLAIGTAAVIFAKMHPAGAGLTEGLRFGLMLAVFILGALVIHNYMMLNVGGRLSMLQGVAYSAEWIAVGAVISLVYRG